MISKLYDYNNTKTGINQLLEQMPLALSKHVPRLVERNTWSPQPQCSVRCGQQSDCFTNELTQGEVG